MIQLVIFLAKLLIHGCILGFIASLLTGEHLCGINTQIMDLIRKEKHIVIITTHILWFQFM